MRSFLITCLLFAAPRLAAAGEPQDKPVDAEQLSQDMIKNVDGWLGTLNDKLQSDKPITDEDFDSLFGEGFLSGSEDPAKDMDLAEDRLHERSGGDRRVIDTYGKWLERKLPPAELAPRVLRGRRHITVTFKTPANSAGLEKVAVRRGRIAVTYKPAAAPAGQESAAAPARRHAVMAVPADADPGKYRISPGKDGVSVIFDRLRKGKNKTEATK